MNQWLDSLAIHIVIRCIVNDTSPPDFSSREYRALSELRYQIRNFLHFSEQQARDHEVEPQQHQLLLTIRGLPEERPATVSELAQRLFLRHHSAVELINRLEARGLVKREHSSVDRRQVLVSLTRTGSALLRKLTEAHRQELETFAPQLISALRAVTRRGKSGKGAAA